MSKAETTMQRIKRLEAEIAQLKAESAPPPLQQEAAVTIRYSRASSIAVPTLEQCEKLIAFVARSGVVPRLASDRDRRDFLAGFLASFHRLAELRRLDGLNLKRPERDWMLEASNWLSERGTSADVSNGSFFAAVVASGDIPYSFAKSDLGIAAYVGLTHDSGARSAQPAWRTVLERGRPRPAEATPTPRSLYQENRTVVRIG